VLRRNSPVYLFYALPAEITQPSASRYADDTTMYHIMIPKGKSSRYCVMLCD